MRAAATCRRPAYKTAAPQRSAPTTWSYRRLERVIAFIGRRLLTMLLSFVLISVIVFITIQAAPGDYLSNVLVELETDRGLRGEAALQLVEGLKRRFGLDQPGWKQYLIWMRNFITGDMGISFAYNRPVASLLGERLALSFGLSVGTLVFTWAIGLPIGIYAATHKNSLGDYAFTFVGFIGISIPNFLLALILMVIVLFVFDQPVGRLFSPAFHDAPWSVGKVLNFIRHMWIPVVVIGTAGTAGTIRVMRANLLSILGQPHMTTARSKGLKESVVVRRHAVRIALNPFVSSLGMSLPALLSGETVTSIVLNLPTAGPLLYGALLSEDIYLAASILQFYGIFLLFGNLLADIGLAWLDPRIRYER